MATKSLFNRVNAVSENITIINWATGPKSRVHFNFLIHLSIGQVGKKKNRLSQTTY